MGKFEISLAKVSAKNMLPFVTVRGKISKALRRFPYLLSVDEKHILKLFPLSSCQYMRTVPEKNCMIQIFQKLAFCKGLYCENDGPSIQGSGARNIQSNCNQMRAYAECYPNQSKTLYIPY